MLSPYGYLFQANPAKPRISEDILTELESYFAALLFKLFVPFPIIAIVACPSDKCGDISLQLQTGRVLSHLQ